MQHCPQTAVNLNDNGDIEKAETHGAKKCRGTALSAKYLLLPTPVSATILLCGRYELFECLLRQQDNRRRQASLPAHNLR